MGSVRIFRWWTGLSGRRQALFAGTALIVIVFAVLAAVLIPGRQPKPIPGRTSTVLLVPGYGGSTTVLDVMAARIRRSGRTATVVHLAGNGTGDLTVQARVLNGYVKQAVDAGSGPVTVIGYSAGGVVAWLWDINYDGMALAGKVITLGAPLHGAMLAALGAAVDPGVCPVACQELVPGSALLTRLQRTSAQDRPPWLSLWTTDDQVVQPPDSARLQGAVNVPLQSVCPGINIQHNQLPSSPLVIGIVLRTLADRRVDAPARGDCTALQAMGALGALPLTACHRCQIVCVGK